MCIDVTTGLPRPAPLFHPRSSTCGETDKTQPLPRFMSELNKSIPLVFRIENMDLFSRKPAFNNSHYFSKSDSEFELPRTRLYIPKTKEEEAIAIKLIFSVFIEEVDGAHDAIVRDVTEEDDLLRRLYIAMYDPRNASHSGKSSLVTSFLWSNIIKRRDEIDKSRQERHQVVVDAIAEYTKELKEAKQTYPVLVVIDSVPEGL